jgi:hypothetical protein
MVKYGGIYQSSRDLSSYFSKDARMLNEEPHCSLIILLSRRCSAENETKTPPRIPLRIKGQTYIIPPLRCALVFLLINQRSANMAHYSMRTMYTVSQFHERLQNYVCHKNKAEPKLECVLRLAALGNSQLLLRMEISG